MFLLIPCPEYLFDGLALFFQIMAFANEMRLIMADEFAYMLAGYGACGASGL